MTQCLATTHIQGGLGNKLFQIAHLIGFTSKNPNYQAFINPKIICKSAHDTTETWQHFIKGLPLCHYRPTIEVVEPAKATGKYLTHPHWQQDITFKGFFQTNKYFNHITDIIIQRFRCPDDVQRVLLRKYDNLDSAYFIHFRRGDYVENPFHFINLTQYYTRCLEMISGIVYVFSDDIEFAREFLAVRVSPKFDFRFVAENEIMSLWLMSLCRLGGICANSTFSWWGAYLNDYPKKRVYYPARFYPHNFTDTSDLIPAEFTAIDV